MAKDMRTWITQLEAAGEILKINRPVNPLTEMGALLWQSREKALLFNNLEGYPGWRALGQAPANLRHAALAFETDLENLVPTVARRMKNRYISESVETGPVKDVILRGKDVDLFQFPAHIAGTRDAGAFITAGLCITRDPDTGIRNMSFHRLQVKGRNKTGILLVPRHTSINLQKYESKDEPMPIAIFIGHHPLYYMAAATTGPYEMDELELAGGLLGEPVKTVRCETIDLEVPCDAEIVLEGHVLPGYREEEGPFSEFQDYYISGTGKNPVIEFQAITRRKDAIYKNLQNGSEMEGCIFHKVPMGAAIYDRIRTVGGFADIKNVLVLPGIFGVVVQMTPRFYGEAKNVLMAALSSEYLHPKVVIAVDDDVNIFNYWEILWAINTRVNPQEDIITLPGSRIHSMDPTAKELFPPGTPSWQRVGGKVIIDATKPPVSDPEARSVFERIVPMGYDHVHLKDFLD
jgi:2,5-furandicarboxylate decarboxylase 1